MTARSSSFVVLDSTVTKGGGSTPTVKAVGLPPAGWPSLVTPTTRGVYEVECRRSSAVAVVMEWLAKGRPSSMAVSALYESEFVRAAAPGPVLSLAEVRDGTGWPEGVGFVQVGA